jgi:hypothetical protein
MLIHGAVFGYDCIKLYLYDSKLIVQLFPNYDFSFNFTKFILTVGLFYFYMWNM